MPSPSPSRSSSGIASGDSWGTPVWSCNYSLGATCSVLPADEVHITHLGSSSLCPSAFWSHTPQSLCPDLPCALLPPVWLVQFLQPYPTFQAPSPQSLDDPSGPLPSKTSFCCRFCSCACVVGVSAPGSRRLPGCLFVETGVWAAGTIPCISLPNTSPGVWHLEGIRLCWNGWEVGGGFPI